MTDLNQTNLDLLQAIEPFNLGEAIDALKALPNQEAWVTFGFGSFVPGDVYSDRGSYTNLALGYIPWDGGQTTVAMLRTRLEDAVGRTFHGYKGGEYRMDRGSILRVSPGRSSSSYHMIVAFEYDGYASVAIHTRYVEY